MGSRIWREDDSLRLVASRTAHPFEAIEYPRLPAKPRATAVTSVLDGGLGAAEVRDRVAVAGEWIDVVKLGWATARLTPAAALREKIAIYRAAGIAVCSGGTFLEIAFAQNRVREFMDGARDAGFSMVEVSNGVHPMSEREKLELVATNQLGTDSFASPAVSGNQLFLRVAFRSGGKRNEFLYCLGNQAGETLP